MRRRRQEDWEREERRAVSRRGRGRGPSGESLSRTVSRRGRGSGPSGDSLSMVPSTASLPALPVRIGCPAGSMGAALFRSVMGSSLDRALFAAVDRGDVEAVRIALDGGASPRAADSSSGRGTALHKACYPTPHLGIVRLLVERGADVNAATADTPLSLAAQAGSIEVVRYLLDHGAQVNFQAPLGGYDTALHRVCDDFVGSRATTCTSENMISVLLENGADRYRVNRDWRAPVDAMTEEGAGAGWDALDATGRVLLRFGTNGFNRFFLLYIKPKPDVDAIVIPALDTCLQAIPAAAADATDASLVPLTIALGMLVLTLLRTDHSEPARLHEAALAVARVLISTTNAVGTRSLRATGLLAARAKDVLGLAATSESDTAVADPLWSDLLAAIDRPMDTAIDLVAACVRDVAALPRATAADPEGTTVEAFGRHVSGQAAADVRRRHPDSCIASDALYVFQEIAASVWSRSPALLRAKRQDAALRDAVQLIGPELVCNAYELLSVPFDTPAIVLLPELDEAYAMHVDGVVTMAQLYVLLAHALDGPLRRMGVGEFPSAVLVASVDGTGPCDVHEHLVLRFRAYTWQALDPATRKPVDGRVVLHSPGGAFDHSLVQDFLLGDAARLDDHIVLALAGPRTQSGIRWDRSCHGGRPYHALRAQLAGVRQLPSNESARWYAVALAAAAAVAPMAIDSN